MCYRRRNQWLRLALAKFDLPLIWLARVVYLLVGAAEGWGGWQGYANPCAVLGHAVLRTMVWYAIPYIPSGGEQLPGWIQVGLWPASLPRARAAKGGPRTHLRLYPVPTAHGFLFVGSSAPWMHATAMRQPFILFFWYGMGAHADGQRAQPGHQHVPAHGLRIHERQAVRAVQVQEQRQQGRQGIARCQTLVWYGMVWYGRGL